jgi:hypothetical protein
MRFALAILVMIIAPPAFAWNEPDGVLGVPWGATQEQLRVKLQDAGQTPSCASPELCGGVRTLFGDAPVGVQYMFPKAGRFEMAVVTFKPEDYRKVRSAFIQRYGAPTSTRREPARIRECGVKYNDVSQWSGDRVVINLKQYSSRSEGRATIMLKAIGEGESTGGKSHEAEPAEEAKDRS